MLFITVRIISVSGFSNRTECPPGKDITCPFSKMVQPDTSSYWSFVEDFHTKGNMGRVLASVITFETTRKQKGLWAAMTGEVPDLCTFDQVPGVSHKDKYSSQLAGVKSRIEVASIDGFVTLQDLVDIKKWVAEVEGVVDIVDSSKGETVLTFLSAGGDLVTQKVNASNVLSILQSKPIEEIGETTLSRVLEGGNLAKW